MENINASIAAMLYGALRTQEVELLLSLEKDQFLDVMDYLKTLHEGKKQLAEDLVKYFDQL